MMLRLALWIAALYPHAWRNRYEAELQALLEEAPLTPRILIDLLRGALDAHVHPRGLPASPPRRMRATISATLSCWIALVFLGAGFAKATEDPPFRAHAIPGAAWLSVAALALTGAGVMALAGAPLAFTVLRQAWLERTPVLRRAVGFTVLAPAAFAALTGLVSAVAARNQGSASPGDALVVVWAGLAVLIGAGCALAARAGLLNARLPAWQLVLGVAGAWLLARIMAALTIAVGLYALFLALDAPSVAASPNGPFNLPTTVVLGSQLVGMVLASALATVTTRRGLAALRGA